MTSTSISASVVEFSDHPAMRQKRATNVGYLIFAFGTMWVAGIALAGGKSVPKCEYIVLGDKAVCSHEVTLASEAMGDHPSLARSRYASNVRLLKFRSELARLTEMWLQS